MPSRFFITGTDTNVGKTLVSALFCAALDALYWKPIQTGTRNSTDRETVIAWAGIPGSRTIPEAYSFVPPVSPHLAARRASMCIDLQTIKPPRIPPSENLIVEGAGGVLVPINEEQLMTDLMRRLKLPVLLVSRTSLGTINHTLLSIAALRAARLDLRGVILCGLPDRDNREAIEHYGKVRVVGAVPRLKSINRSTLLQAFRMYFDHKVFAP